MGIRSKHRRARSGPTWLATLVTLLVAGVSLVAPPGASALGGKDAGTAITAAPDGFGYAIISASGGQYNYGSSKFTGSLAGKPLSAPMVDSAAAPDGGTWLVGADGGVFALGGARFHGSMGGKPLAQPITAIVASPSGRGYLLVARDGGTFAFGDYKFPGSLAGTRLNAPVVDAARSRGGGLWMVAEDGGVFSLSAPFFGSATREANPPAAPPVGSPATGSNGGTMSVPCPRGSSIRVAAQIAPNVARLLSAANASGVALCGWGWRSAEDQIRLRIAHCGKANVYVRGAKCRPPTAMPGNSMHEKGLAIDFDHCQTRSTPCYKWLSQHAAEFGLHNLPSEPWHWSTNGR